MISPEVNQIQEKSLHANFTEVQQVHFDKLMAKLKEISDGLGFDELKEKAETGDRDALQVLRDYIENKEQIVEFIENKRIPLEPEEKTPYLTREQIVVGKRVMLPDGQMHGDIVKVDAQGFEVQFSGTRNPTAYDWEVNDFLVEEYHEQTEINGIRISIGYDSTYQDYTLYFPQLDPDDKVQAIGISDQVFRIDENPKNAKKVYDFAMKEAETVADVYELYKKAKAFADTLGAD
ncbi:hypothetical protein HN858_03415 [Candidatus Falkowbacteria bacterium]|jgi:hypothetical protein|nr:hypothetical protein [Candidatus Falkowbacteria bacterium]MBT6574155.1 hypothetical protein [Candidatus Falkowbacteria bacterium]MBT7348698.1 hypothetical protein [Candidatus Falkowbacteria bacterium]MBT7500488.1 hypothetical protein [Candidatus Falkowbacteria bacterium]